MKNRDKLPRRVNPYPKGGSNVCASCPARVCARVPACALGRPSGDTAATEINQIQTYPRPHFPAPS
jgi:hypothetical protein